MLTRRQREFLTTAVELAAVRGGVHYTEVAEALGVSRWTAYDVLNGLAEKGWLRVSHEITREGGAGRSRVLFQPTRKALLLLYGDERPDGAGRDGLFAEVHQGLWAKVAQAREKGVWNTLHELVGELRGINQPLLFCAYLLLILLVAVRALNQGDDQAIVGYLLPLLTGPQAALVTLAGFVLAYLVHRDPHGNDGGMLWRQLGSFEEQVKRLNHEERQYLCDFTVDLISRLWPEQPARAGGAS